MSETGHREGVFRFAPARVDQLTGYGAAERPALTFRAETLSYRDLREQVARVAQGLHALGLRRGERVVIYAEKRIETVVALLAVSAAGGVFVPVNPRFRARQLAHVIADCSGRVVISTTERLDTVRAALEGSPEVGHVVLIGDATSDETALFGRVVTDWSELVAAAPEPVPGSDGVIDIDLAAILYTSGSTGSPKGVVLTHRNLLAGAASVAGYLGHTQDDVVLSVLPLSFDAGLSQLTTTLIAGAHVVLVNYLLPREVIKLCTQHRVTALTGVPPLWIQLAGQRWPDEARHRLRYFANTGGRMPLATLTRLREIFPAAAPFLMYGLTEAFRSTYLDPAQVERRPDSIGRAIPNAEVLVVRPDGAECEPHEHGELVHRGALVAAGYWNDPVRTAERFRPLPGHETPAGPERAVWSGDTVYRDEEGFLYFVGRTDDMIKTSGYRVSPTEIEEAAYATGLVEEAVALGIGDERLGHRIVLIVRAAGPGLQHEQLVRALAPELPRYMLPERTVLMEEIPRSVNGKFDRVELRRLVGPDREVISR